jgi:hypothetical protein
LPSIQDVRKRRRKKVRVPTRRVAEKLAIWEAHNDPVGHKFYGKAKNDGEWTHFEFSVITERRMSRHAMYLCVKKVMGKTSKGKKLPVKHYYHAYDGFHNLLLRTEWEKFEEVLVDYVHTAT